MVWKISLPMFTELPITGIGYGNYAVQYLDYQAKWFAQPEHQQWAYKATNMKLAHNEFLQVFYETGLIGGFIFLFLIILAFYYLIRKFREGHSKVDFKYYLTVFSFLSLIIFHGFVDDTLHFFSLNYLFIILLGMIPAKKIYLNFSRIKSFIFYPSIILVLLSSLYLSLSLFDRYQGYSFWAHAQQSTSSTSALPWFEKALSIIPNEGELLFQYGSALSLNGKYNKGINFLNESLKTYQDKNENTVK